MSNSKYVVVKLVTGDTFLATLLKESTDSIDIIYPITIKALPTVKGGSINEQIVIGEYCAFTDAVDYTFKTRDVIFVKPMNDYVETTYKKVIQEMYLETPSKDSKKDSSLH